MLLHRFAANQNWPRVETAFWVRGKQAFFCSTDAPHKITAARNEINLFAFIFFFT